jgi:hypothetical protein
MALFFQEFKNFKPYKYLFNKNKELNLRNIKKKKKFSSIKIHFLF